MKAATPPPLRHDRRLQLWDAVGEMICIAIGQQLLMSLGRGKWVRVEWCIYRFPYC